MIKIDKKNRLPKRCNKNQAEKLRALRIRNYNINELVKEILRRNDFDTDCEM